MSIAAQITRIQTDRNTIRNKLVELGLATGTDNLDVLAEAIDNIKDNGDVTVTVKEGETYTIPAGYHSGSGTVSGIAGGGNYTLQSKTVTPTKKTQNITCDDGYYGIADVVVNPIPDAYQDVTSVTASAGDVLTGKVIVSSTGVVTAGSMPNNGAVAKTLTTSDASYTVPAGYHNGSGKVQIVSEDKSVTPTKSAQDITATSGKVLNKVTVAAIPDAYQDVTAVTVIARDVLEGEIFVESDGTVTEGTMPYNGAVSQTLDTSTTSYTVPEGYHNGSGAVSITLETKTATPTKSSQTINATSGKVISSFTVNPIPDEYQDVTAVTATADTVLTGSDFVDAEGNVIEGAMANNGAVSKVLDTTTTSQAINKGYHNGEGVVSISLETKTATPTKATQNITPSSGKVLSKVTVNPIPDAYQDVTAVTATADKVMSGYTIVESDGVVTEGTMPVNVAANEVLYVDATSYTIPKGYHSGAGTVSVNLETKTVTPTKANQVITPTAGKLLSKVSVEAIPAAYQDVSEVDAPASAVMEGCTYVTSAGVVTEGTMPRNGDVTATIDGLTVTAVTIPAGYTTGGTVSLTSDIEEQLAAI